MIVVGVDGSEAGVKALEFALEEARLRGAEVKVVSAWHIPPAAYETGWAPVAARHRRLRETCSPRRRIESRRGQRGGLRRLCRDDRAPGPGGRRPGRRGEGRRAPRRRVARPRRLPRPAARLGQPAVRAPRALPGRDRARTPGLRTDAHAVRRAALPRHDSSATYRDLARFVSWWIPLTRGERTVSPYDRLRGLIETGITLSSELSLETLLKKVIDTAGRGADGRSLRGARRDRPRRHRARAVHHGRHSSRS